MCRRDRPQLGVKVDFAPLRVRRLGDAHAGQDGEEERAGRDRVDGADLLDHRGSLPPLDHRVASVLVIAWSLRRDALEEFPRGHVRGLPPFAGDRRGDHRLDAAQGGACARMGSTSHSGWRVFSTCSPSTASTSSRPAPASRGNYDDLLAGVGVLHWRDQEIEWVQQPIIERNPPRGGSSSYRWRPRFVCGFCGAGAYVLHLVRGGSFACAACAGSVRPSRVSPRGPDETDLRRLARLRAQLGVRGLLDDPNVSRPPKTAPRSVWQWKRRVRALRLLELQIARRLEGLALEKFISREDPWSGSR
jgi:hypothetical protein